VVEHLPILPKVLGLIPALKIMKDRERERGEERKKGRKEGERERERICLFPLNAYASV
jgi:hypothetical protein